MCQIFPGAVPNIEGKQLKPIALLAKNRASVLPDIPTAHEQGMTDFEALGWFGFFFPKATPRPIVQKLHDATVAVMNQPATQERLAKIGADLVAPERRSPEYFQKFVESEIVKWRDPILKSGVSMD
jgi:tripartite-type tricarboxylate transporter receptor subunit TctC